MVAFWTSGPDLRSQWGTLGHFLEKGMKRSQMDLQLDLQMKRFSVHFCNLYDFVSLAAGAWRTPVSSYFSRGVFLESGERNMHLTTVFTVPNAHHIFGSRNRFSEFVVHFESHWIAFLFLGVLSGLWRRSRLQHIFAVF